MRARLGQRRRIREWHWWEGLQCRVLGAGQLAKKVKPVAQAVAIGQRGKTIGALGKEASGDRQQKRRSFFSRRVKINSLGVHVGSKKAGDTKCASQRPLNARYS